MPEFCRLEKRFAMGSGHYAFILAIFITQIFFADLAGGNEEEEADKYVAQDEVDQFNDQLKIFGDEYGKSWMILPNGDGKSQFVLLDAQPWKAEGRFLSSSYTQSEMPDLVKLYSYTKESPKGEKINLENLDSFNYDSSKPTKMIFHGWMADSNSLVIKGIRDAYLEEQDVNVIGVDWSSIAKDFFYPNAAGATEEVGKYIASVIDVLVERKNARYNDFHIIGHSLGAHASGFAGNNTRRKIGRITGLDPALPGFQLGKGPEDRLDPSDANFVDVIHTCAGILGLSIKAGHVDFFPNGGSPFQPGCDVSKLPTITQSCSHGRAHEYFAESIRRHDFKAVACPDWTHFKNHNCGEIYTYMGEYASSAARGPFYLKTNNAPPFGLGLSGTFYDA